MVVVYDPIKDTEKKKYGVQAHYNRARPLVVAAFEQFLEDDSEKLFFLEPVLVAGGVNYKTFYDNDWNRDRRMDHDGYFMTHELRDGNLYITGVTLSEDEGKVEPCSMATLYMCRGWRCSGLGSSRRALELPRYSSGMYRTPWYVCNRVWLSVYSGV
jgi:hypothetical protein